MTAVVLHLSDIHIKTAKDPVLKNAEKIAASTYSRLPSASVVFIVVTGDIAYSGKVEEYSAATKFLNQIRDLIISERPVPVNFVVVPGNHDCDFSLGNKNREKLTKSIEAEGADDIDESVIEICTLVQENYFSFVTEITGSTAQSQERLWHISTFEVEGKTVVFDCINVAWASKRREIQGTLAFPYGRYESLAQISSDIRIALFHHPLNWFSQSTYRPFRQFLRRIANLVMTGHEHQGNFAIIEDSEVGASLWIEGCVLQGEPNLSDSSFNVLEINLEDQTCRASKYVAINEDYESDGEGSWSDFRRLPAKVKSNFEITSHFAQLLTDPGGSFDKGDGRRLTLGDLFVYPDMHIADKLEDRQVFSTKVLLEQSRIEPGVLLRCEEKVGATSLLYRLYDYYHSTGMVPVFLRGKEIKGSTERDIEDLITTAVTEQYGRAALSAFMKTSTTKKLLLIDNFDEGRVKSSSHRGRALGELKKRFGAIMLTVAETFNFEEAIPSNDQPELSDFRAYVVLPFSQRLRAELVRRWFSLSNADGSLDDDTFYTKCYEAEKLIESVMIRNLVPQLPLYLLTLLQGIDAGASGGFHDSALGQYYHFLMLQGFRNAGVPERQWSLVVEYCTHLSWHYHSMGRRELDEADLRHFNDLFCREQHTVDFGTRLQNLVAARVLYESGGYYKFRYHYIFYYLKGRHLADNIQDIDVRQYIERCCRHLYVRENANTILFLAHHADKNDFFLRCLADALAAPFSKYASIAFDGKDTDAIRELVRDLPELRYHESDPEENRRRIHDMSDDDDGGDDGLIDAEEDGEELSFMAQLVTTFKTVEILGQLLKNQIGGLKRVQRVDMLLCLFKAPLRGITAYLELFLADRKKAVDEIERMLEANHPEKSKESRAKAAQQYISLLVQVTAYGLIQKTASSIAFEALHEDIKAASNQLGSLAARLIEVGVLLDNGKPLPREPLQRLFDETKNDIVAGRMVELLTLRRLYMYRTAERDKQWLASIGVLDLRRQQTVEFKSRRHKLSKA